MRKDSVKITLRKDDITLVLFLLSREIIEYRRSPYDGVQVYVQNCRDARRRLKAASANTDDHRTTNADH